MWRGISMIHYALSCTTLSFSTSADTIHAVSIESRNPHHLVTHKLNVPSCKILKAHPPFGIFQSMPPLLGFYPAREFDEHKVQIMKRQRMMASTNPPAPFPAPSSCPPPTSGPTWPAPCVPQLLPQVPAMSKVANWKRCYLFVDVLFWLELREMFITMLTKCGWHEKYKYLLYHKDNKSIGGLRMDILFFSVPIEKEEGLTLTLIASWKVPSLHRTSLVSSTKESGETVVSSP